MQSGLENISIPVFLFEGSIYNYKQEKKCCMGSNACQFHTFESRILYTITPQGAVH